MTAAINTRAAALHKFQTQLLPEVVAGGLIILMTMQLPELGPLPVLAQLGLFALLIAARPAESLQAFLRWWPLLLVPILAFASFIWSDLPGASARYGFQLLFTAFAGALLAVLVPPHRFISVLFLAMFVFCLLCIASGRQGDSAHGAVLVGLTGSKNQMALAGFNLLVPAIAVALMRQSPNWLRLLAIPGALLGLLVVAITASATAFLLTAAAAPGLIALHLMQRFTPAARVGVFVVLAVIAVPLIFLAPEISNAIDTFMWEVLGKDPTLTGRTYLWAQAQQLIEARPILGYGYQAIWLGESADTLGLLRWAGISDGRSFHFHNTYLQVGVDTGMIGMVVLIGTLAATGFAGVRQAIFTPTTATSFFFLSFLLTIVLTFTDVVLAPMQPRTLLLFAAAVYLYGHVTKPAEPRQRVYRKSWANRR
jgi:exopolysaccharide production protein ExoQ